MGKSENSNLDVPTERVRSKISLCKLLSQNKTKVGCFRIDPEEDKLDDNVANMNSSMESSSFNKKSRNLLRKTITRGYSDPETNTTRLTLCCAVTESSHTPPHSHFHTSAQSGGIPENESRVVQTRDFGSQTIDSAIDIFDKKSLKSSGKEKLEKKEVEQEVKPFIEHVRKSETHCSLSRLPSNDSVKFADDIDEGEDDEEEVLSSASSNSLWLCKNEITSKVHSGKRLSVDNLMVSPTFSARHSSPDSVKSVPEMKDRRRRLSHGISTTKENKKIPTPLACAEEPNQVSMDSLARQSLLAAQVLHLIPTEKARERNFLQGRIGANSLLGAVELDKVLPKREIKIFVGTWNMNGEPPPQELNDFMLPNGLEHVPDIIAVGTQESTPERFDWEVKIQETIGPSHVLFHSSALGTIHLAIFLRRDLLWYCSVPEESSQNVRPGMAFRTKGAVAIAFILFGTSYLFITSHLTAHQDKVKERIHDVKRIVRSLDLPKNLPLRHKTKNKDVTQNFDCVFWFGDLNFRLAQPREDVLHWVEEYKFPLLVDLKADQLKKLILDGTCLSTFQEGSITFPPTYKYDVGTQNFDTSSKQRTPAYTDRILFKSKGGNLSCVTYSSVPTICTSDHKPVWGVYKGTVRPGIDSIPLSAGLFNREVYLEGIKRRAADLDKKEFGLAAFCSVQ